MPAVVPRSVSSVAHEGAGDAEPHARRAVVGLEGTFGHPGRAGPVASCDQAGLTLQAIRGPGRLLGVDLGARRIGVAVCDSGWVLATGATTVTRTGDRSGDHHAIARLVDEYEAIGVIVGIPLSLSGRAGPAADLASREVDELRHALSVPVDTVDERLTTMQASTALRAAGRSSRRQRTVIDQSAAAGLLQTWLDSRRGTLR